MFYKTANLSKSKTAKHSLSMCILRSLCLTLLNNYKTVRVTQKQDSFNRIQRYSKIATVLFHNSRGRKGSILMLLELLDRIVKFCTGQAQLILHWFHICQNENQATRTCMFCIATAVITLMKKLQKVPLDNLDFFTFP